MTTTLTVANMMTDHCKRAVFTSLSGIEGIIHADVQLGHVVVEHTGTVSIKQLSDAIAVAGYTVIEGVENRRTLPLV